MAEIKKLDILFRQIYKLAPGLPARTSTEKLYQLGIHNTWQELIETLKASQMERLKLTPTGRATLYSLGYEPSGGPENQTRRIPHALREYIMVENVPRNMHRVCHNERREARVKTLRKAYSKNSSTRYVDAARSLDIHVSACTLNSKETTLNSSGKIAGSP